MVLILNLLKNSQKKHSFAFSFDERVSHKFVKERNILNLEKTLATSSWPIRSTPKTFVKVIKSHTK